MNSLYLVGSENNTWEVKAHCRLLKKADGASLAKRKCEVAMAKVSTQAIGPYEGLLLKRGKFF